jgi:hypothetical protein
MGIERVAKNRRGLLCPKCLSYTRVLDVDSSPDESQTIRRRECATCLYRFFSEEKPRAVPTGGADHSTSTP